MRIAQISTLSAPVRRETAGSVESLVWNLTRELRRLGHDVTVFGTAGSEPDGELVATLPGPYAAEGSLDDWHLCEWVNLCRAVEQSGRFDVLHSHAYLWGLPLQRLSRAPMVHTMHILPDLNSARLWTMEGRACVTAISRHQWSRFPELQTAAVIPHGLAPGDFAFHPEPSDYVCYLGRFTSGKGPREAIEAARSLGLRIVLAGPPNAYFHEEIEPMVDGRMVQYAGFVQGAERNKLLGGAKALLFPVQSPEPFGLVMIEAMLCGTPVAALQLGAVPEVIDEGVTGFYTPAMADFSEAVLKCFALDRARVRLTAEARFSAARMARDYECVYRRAAEERLS
jgi:glycosyltransferase involved in cell wall biosynthesis